MCPMKKFFFAESMTSFRLICLDNTGSLFNFANIFKKGEIQMAIHKVTKQAYQL